MPLLPWIGSVALVLVLAAPVRALDITTCGQVVPRRTTGVLQVDLSCTPTPSNDNFYRFGIELEGGATLDLNGHTLTLLGCGNAAGVLCNGNCVVTSSTGTATIVGPSPQLNEGCNGIFGRTVSASKLAVSSFGNGIFAGRRLTAADVTASNNFRGLRARTAVLDNVTANDNGDAGILTQDHPSRVRVTNSTVSGNTHFGIFNGGVGGGSIHAAGVTVTNNGCEGVVAGEGKHVQLTDSHVTGQPKDVETAIRPLLLNTVCGISSHLTGGCADGPNGTWGVCANDVSV